MAVVLADIILSALHQSANSPVMPLYSHMLGICKAGSDKAWADKRTMACSEKTAKMSSVGWQRLRPCALIWDEGLKPPPAPPKEGRRVEEGRRR